MKNRLTKIIPVYDSRLLGHELGSSVTGVFAANSYPPRSSGIVGGREFSLNKAQPSLSNQLHIPNFTLLQAPVLAKTVQSLVLGTSPLSNQDQHNYDDQERKMYDT